MNFIQRFESQVVKTDGCWFWRGGTNKQGYGQFGIFSTVVTAYRFAYELYVGPVPKNRELHHSCENRVCVRPDHLEVLTREENIRRTPRLQSARALRYDTSSSQIRKRRAEKGLTRKELAGLAGISEYTVVNAEIGKHTPHDSTLRKIADALGCSFSDLVESPTLSLVSEESA